MNGWFTMQRDKKFESFFFCKDDKGQDIFFPWGCPGEGYLIDDNKKKKLIPFIYLALFASGVGVVTGIFSLPIFLFFYFGCIFLFTRKLEIYVQTDQFNKLPKLLKLLAALWLVQIIIGIAGFAVDLSRRDFWATSIIYITLFYGLLMLFVWLRKGYIFQRKPVSSDGE